MPKILITGNGFDLNFGLPTYYSDFIKILSHLETKNIDFDSLYSNSHNYAKILENFNKFNFNYEKTELLKKEIKKNVWYNFFKEEFEIETWIDFENKIEYVLKILFSSVEYIKKNIFDKGSLSEDKIHYNTKLFNNNIEIIEVLNKFNIIFVDDHYGIKLNQEYLIKKYNFFTDINLDKITKYLYQELIHFKTIFNYYFEVFVFPFYDNVKIKIDRTLFASINKHFTFNYTPTFEKIYKKSNTTNFLHGTIDSNTNQIVLGINEIPNNQIDKKYFLPFTKYFQKLNNNTDYIFIKEYDKKKSYNYIFFFWGHSLDSSDEDYINEVFDFVETVRSSIKKIVVIYHDDNSKSNLLINLLNIRGKKNIQEHMRTGTLTFNNINSPELKKHLSRDISSSSMMTPQWQ